MIIVRIETDIAPLCAPRQLLSYKAAGILFAQTPPLVETLAGAFAVTNNRGRFKNTERYQELLSKFFL